MPDSAAMPKRPTLIRWQYGGAWVDGAKFTAYADAVEARIAALEAERDSLRTVLPMLELAEAQKEAACNLLRAEQAEARDGK